MIPAPLIFGALTDAACIVWEEKCNKRGNCWLYDSNKFRHLLHGPTFGFVFAGALISIVLIFTSNKLTNFYNEDENEREEHEVECTTRF